MEKLNDSEFSNKPVSNSLYNKAKSAISAGIISTGKLYSEMDKKTIKPNDSEKSLHGEGMASKQNMGSEKKNTPSV